MKKTIFAITAAFISALAVENGACAQSAINPEIPEPQKNITTIEKVIKPANDAEAETENINAKAIKNFASIYKNVSVESWEKIKDGFTASFNSNGITYRIYFGKKGKWLGSLKGYEESQMPADVRKIVKRIYYDFSITYVQEAETLDSEGEPTYIVHLEDKDKLLQVRVCNGNMELWRQYKKQH